MTKTEIEAYRANFEYGRKCWQEFAATHPVDRPWPEKPERKIIGQDPFKRYPEPKPRPQPRPQPKPVYTEPVRPKKKSFSDWLKWFLS